MLCDRPELVALAIGRRGAAVGRGAALAPSGGWGRYSFRHGKGRFGAWTPGEPPGPCSVHQADGSRGSSLFGGAPGVEGPGDSQAEARPLPDLLIPSTSALSLSGERRPISGPGRASTPESFWSGELRQKTPGVRGASRRPTFGRGRFAAPPSTVSQPAGGPPGGDGPGLAVGAPAPGSTDLVPRLHPPRGWLSRSRALEVDRRDYGDPFRARNPSVAFRALSKASSRSSAP